MSRDVVNPSLFLFPCLWERKGWFQGLKCLDQRLSCLLFVPNTKESPSTWVLAGVDHSILRTIWKFLNSPISPLLAWVDFAHFIDVLDFSRLRCTPLFHSQFHLWSFWRFEIRGKGILQADNSHQLPASPSPLALLQLKLEFFPHSSILEYYLTFKTIYPYIYFSTFLFLFYSAKVKSSCYLLLESVPFKHIFLYRNK